MVDKDKIYSLYEAMMKVDTITTKEIKELGFTQNEIAKLVEDGTIQRLQRGIYNFGDVNKLYIYGKELVDSKRREEGFKVFERCFLLDCSNVDVALQLMVNSVRNKEYEEALKYYDVLYESDNTNRKYLYYLYLLGFVVELPEHYRNVVKSLTPDMIMVEETDNYTRMLNNTIGLVFNGKLTYAYSKRFGWHKDKSMSVDDYVEVTMLKASVSCSVESKKAIEDSILEERYDDALALMEKESNIRELPIYNRYVNYLLNDIIRMINFKEVHDVIVNDKNTINMFVALDNYDYESALKLNVAHCNSNNMDVNKSMMYILLTRIIKLRKEILNIVDEEVKKEEPVTEVIEENVEIVVEEVVDKPISYSQVVADILSNNEAAYAVSLSKYFNQLGVPYYYTLITSLIEIGKIKGTGINRILVLLTQISNNSYVFNEEEYITLFYESVIRREYEVATLYLFILEAVSSLSDEMISELNNVMKMYKYQNSEVLFENVQDDQLEGQLEMDMSDTVHVPSEDVVKSQVVEPKTEKAGFVPLVKSKKVKDTLSEEYRLDLEYIDRKISELVESRGLITLRPMDAKRRARIHDIVSKRREASTFSIGSGDQRRIVLRFVGNVYVPLKDTIKLADEAYYARDYETALRGYLDILGTNNPKTFIYAKVGLTYMKMWKIDKAIEYLTIATELSKATGDKFDFSDLIGSLDGTIEQHEKKPKVKFRLDEFTTEEDTFGVQRIDDMLAYKDVNGLDYEEACENMGFTYEEYLLTLLVLAKRAYGDKHDDLGDKYLKMVEKSGNKSRKVVEKFQEVQKNKKFYKNRGNSFTKKSSE